MDKMSIGYTAHNLENVLLKLELLSLIECNVKLDFIIFHQKLYKRKLLNTYKSIKRHKTIDDIAIQKYLKDVKVYNIPDINSNAASEVLKQYKKALIICNGGVLRQSTIKSNPNIIFLNKHCSQLPKYRGVNNVEWALWDSSPIYASIIRIHHGIDEGDILYQAPLTVNFEIFNTVAKVRNYCFQQISILTGIAISGYLNGKLDFKPQSGRGEAMSQYYSMHPILKDKLEDKLSVVSKK